MLQLDAEEVARRLGRLPLVEALDAAFRSEFQAPVRHHFAVGAAPDGKELLLLMPAWQVGGCIGVKLTTVFPGNASHGLSAVHATYALFDGTTGVPLAVLDGTELTRRRTAAASALATRYLSRPDAGRLLMVGTGSLIPHLIESHSAVRPIRSVRIWGRRAEAARSLAGKLSRETRQVEAADDLEAAVRWADIISCATLAEAPLIRGIWLQPGQHLDLVGAYTPAMREADDEALRRASIHVDTRAGALVESGEIVHALASGSITIADIRGELADLARGSIPGRRSAEEITLFKSVGTAIEDLAAAQFALRRAPAQSEG